MIDLRPLLSQPIMFVMGALAHLGIFATLIIAILLGSTSLNPPQSA
jgi:Na+-transporting methylmalonyl-CoA/oxaloacetate decarboxylase beta subunit